MKTNQLHLVGSITQKVQNNYLIPFVTSFHKCEQKIFTLKISNWFLLDYSGMAMILRAYVCVSVCLCVHLSCGFTCVSTCMYMCLCVL